MVQIRKQSLWRELVRNTRVLMWALLIEDREHALCSVLRQLRGWRWGSGKRTGWKQKGQGIFIKSLLLTLPNTMGNLTDGAREAALEKRARAGLPKDLAAQLPHQVAHKCP